MYLAIDFDNTIHDNARRPAGRKMGPPMPGAVEAMQTLHKYHTLIVFTARLPAGHSAVQQWLQYFKIPYHHVTNIKPPWAQVFIDDRGYRFTSWDQVMKDLPFNDYPPAKH